MLPEASEIAVRAVSVAAPRNKMPGTRRRSASRTPIALYTQTSPASIAPRGPSRRSVNSSSRTGTSVPSTMRGAT